MPHRIIAFVDSLLILLMASIVAPGAALMTQEEATGRVSELRSLLIPFMGAMCTLVPLVLWRIRKEPANILLGKGFMALFFGSVTNLGCNVVFPSLVVLLHPVILFAGGGVSGIICFALIYAVYNALDKRATRLGEDLVDAVEDHFPFRAKKPEAHQDHEPSDS